MSPAHSWLLVLAIFLAAWLLVRVLVVVDYAACRLTACLQHHWRAHRLQRQQEQFRTRRDRVRSLARRDAPPAPRPTLFYYRKGTP